MRDIFKIVSSILAASLLWIGAAQAAGPTGGTAGPTPPPNPWIVVGPSVTYNKGSALLPQGVTGGDKGVGTINVSGGYYVGGVNITGLPCTDCARKSVTNTFTANQIINVNGGAVPTAQSGMILQGVGAAASTGRIEIDTYAGVAHFTGVRANGTIASPTTLVANDEIVGMTAWGYDGTSRSGPASAIRLFSAATWSNTSHPTYIDLATTTTSSTTLTTRVRIENDGGVTIPSTVTGSTKGVGSINISGNYYVNGSAAATTVNGQVCALGASCTISASAASISVGTTGVTAGTTTRVLYDNAGTLGEYTISGSGSVAMTTAPTLNSPILASSTPTTAGSLGWGAFINYGDGTSNHTLANVDSAQTLTNKTISGGIYSGASGFTGQAIFTGTSAPASAAGNTVIMGTLAAPPTLSNNGQAFLYNTTTGGVVLQGAGSTYDMILMNKSGGTVVAVPTGGGTFNMPNIALGTCSGGAVVLDGTLNLVKIACPTATVASGTAALGTSAITSGSCATVLTVTATGTATTDVVTASFNSDPSAVTGYAPSTNGMLTILSYPTANNVNFKVCNNTLSSVTPGAITLNWRVVR